MLKSGSKYTAKFKDDTVISLYHVDVANIMIQPSAFYSFLYYFGRALTLLVPAEE